MATAIDLAKQLVTASSPEQYRVKLELLWKATGEAGRFNPKKGYWARQAVMGLLVPHLKQNVEPRVVAAMTEFSTSNGIENPHAQLVDFNGNHVPRSIVSALQAMYKFDTVQVFRYSVTAVGVVSAPKVHSRKPAYGARKNTDADTAADPQMMKKTVWNCARRRRLWIERGPSQ